MLKINLSTFQWEPLIEKLDALFRENPALTPVAAITGNIRGFRSFKNALFGVRIVQAVGGQVFYQGPPEYKEPINTIIQNRYDIIATKTAEAFKTFATQLKNGDLEQALYTAWMIKRKYRLELEWAVLKDGRYISPSKRREYSLSQAISQNKIRLFGRYLQDKDVYRLSKSFGQDLVLVSYFWFTDELPKQPLSTLMKELRTTFPTVDYRIRDMGGAIVWEAYDRLTGELLRRIALRKPRELIDEEAYISISNSAKIITPEDFYAILKRSTYYTPKETISGAVDRFIENLRALPVTVYYEFIPSHLEKAVALALAKDGEWHLAVKVPLKPYAKPHTKLVILPVKIIEIGDNHITVRAKTSKESNDGYLFEVTLPISQKELEKIKII